MFKEFHYQTRGRGHIAEGVPCQDCTAYRSRGGVQVMCLADGAGSATQSHLGAQALVDEGCKLLIERFTEFVARDDGAQVKREVAQVLLGRLEQTAHRRGCDLKDLASTFLAVAASGDHFIVMHIGDGAIGYVKDGDLKVASAPDSDEIATQTTFVTSGSAASSMRLLRGSLRDVAGFVLMSDGTATRLFDMRSRQMAPACSKMIALVGSAPTVQVRNPSYKRQLRRLLDTKIRQATKDDCSIGILGRRIDANDTPRSRG